MDACEALRDQLDAVVLVGAQAIYLHTGGIDVALAEATKDSDLALDTRRLTDNPLIEQAMSDAGFYRHPVDPQPGGWFNPQGIPVDLMVAAAQSGVTGAKRRGVNLPPHDARAARRAVGLEAAMVDRTLMDVAALADTDPRHYRINVAGPAALLVAKLHKIGERQATGRPERLNDKDAHDIYRLLVATPTDALAEGVERLTSDPLSAAVTAGALDFLRDLFAAGPDALGSLMAGRAEGLAGGPDTVAAAAGILAADLLDALARRLVADDRTAPVWSTNSKPKPWSSDVVPPRTGDATSWS